MDKKAGKAWSHPHYLHEEKADAGAGIEHAGWQNRSNQPVVLELLQAPPLHLPLSPLISAPVPLFCALCPRPPPNPIACNHDTSRSNKIPGKAKSDLGLQKD